MADKEILENIKIYLDKRKDLAITPIYEYRHDNLMSVARAAKNGAIIELINEIKILIGILENENKIK